jgi:hypothetical protein
MLDVRLVFSPRSITTNHPAQVDAMTISVSDGQRVLEANRALRE